jgi:hypothetical protein
VGENLSDDEEGCGHRKDGASTIGDGDDGKLFSLVHVSYYTILSTKCKQYLRVFFFFLCA